VTYCVELDWATTVIIDSTNIDVCRGLCGCRRWLENLGIALSVIIPHHKRASARAPIPPSPWSLIFSYASSLLAATRAWLRLLLVMPAILAIASHVYLYSAVSHNIHDQS